MRKIIALLLLATMPAIAAPAKRHKRRVIDDRVFPPTPDSLILQNAAIDAMGLPRIADSKALAAMIAQNALVRVTENRYVKINPKLESERRYVRPFVDAFLQELGTEYFDRFEEPIQVNSAVRTVKTQMKLLRWNHNAAPVHGEKASAHLAGVAVDLQRRGLTKEQVEFIQQRLLLLVHLNMVIVEEELKQPCFHVVVTGEYPYLPPMDLRPIDLPPLGGAQDESRRIEQPRECPEGSRLERGANSGTPRQLRPL